MLDSAETRGVGSPATVVEKTAKNRYRSTPAPVLLKRGILRPAMGASCPSCGSADVKSVPLAYQEGVQAVQTRTRLSGIAPGLDGPDVFTGAALTRGLHQTNLSKTLSPPAKWSYWKLVAWSAVIWLGCLIVYIHSVVSSVGVVSATPGKVFVFVSALAFIALLVLFGWHNFVVFPRRYMEWDRSFFCSRCGTVWK